MVASRVEELSARKRNYEDAKSAHADSVVLKSIADRTFTRTHEALIKAEMLLSDAETACRIVRIDRHESSGSDVIIERKLYDQEISPFPRSQDRNETTQCNSAADNNSEPTHSTERSIFGRDNSSRSTNGDIDHHSISSEAEPLLSTERNLRGLETSSGGADDEIQGHHSLAATEVESTHSTEKYILERGTSSRSVNDERRHRLAVTTVEPVFSTTRNNMFGRRTSSRSISEADPCHSTERQNMFELGASSRSVKDAGGPYLAESDEEPAVVVPTDRNMCRLDTSNSRAERNDIGQISAQNEVERTFLAERYILGRAKDGTNDETIENHIISPAPGYLSPEMVDSIEDDDFPSRKRERHQGDVPQPDVPGFFGMDESMRGTGWEHFQHISYLPETFRSLLELMDFLFANRENESPVYARTARDMMILRRKLRESKKNPETAKILSWHHPNGLWVPPTRKDLESFFVVLMELS